MGLFPLAYRREQRSSQSHNKHPNLDPQEAQRTPFEEKDVWLLHPELRRPNPADEPQLSTETKQESTFY